METKKTYFAPLIIIALIVLLGLFLYWRPQALPDYTIQGVPSVSIFNARTIDPYPRLPVPAAIVSVFKYWKLTPDPKTFALKFPFEPNFQNGANFTYDDLARYAMQEGLNAKTETLLTPSDIKKYINADVRTPLIFSIPMNASSPESISTFVLIGVSEKEKKIIAHGFYNGNNYEISFDDLEKRFAAVSSKGNTHTYVVIQPKNLTATLANLPKETANYPARLNAMDNLADLFTNVAASFNATQDTVKEPILIKIIGSDKFSELPPWLRMSYYTRLASVKIGLGKLVDGKKYADLATKLIPDAYKPFREWLAPIKIYQEDLPYHALGHYYEKSGNKSKAQEFFNKK